MASAATDDVTDLFPGGLGRCRVRARAGGIGRMTTAATDPLWFRIAWPILKVTFFGLGAAALVLDALIVAKAAGA